MHLIATKILLPFAISFIAGVLITPAIANFLYRNNLWKKKSVEKTIDGKPATISAMLHNDGERKVPKMGGSVIWIATILTSIFVYILSTLNSSIFYDSLDFISRSQTWILLAALVLGGLLGLVDDYLATREVPEGGYVGGGLSLRKRVLGVALIGLFCGYWFYEKLGVETIGTGLALFPVGGLEIGWLIIPLFVIVMVGIYSGGIIDGVDGLAGGVFAAMFAAYSGIAFSLNQYDIAAFSAAIVGGIVAFLWFNIPPARFYMSETGTMALTITLVVIAFMTDSLGGGFGLMVLPLIALPLILTTLSVIIQLLSKKFRGKKVFLVSPLHNHFQAIGWPAAKVSMRYWIVSALCAVLGLLLSLG